MGIRHPKTIEDITAEWMNWALHEGGVCQESTVSDIETTSIGGGVVGFLSGVARVLLTYNQARPDLPTSVVVKMPIATTWNRELGDSYYVYEREVRFFQEIAPHSPLRIPRCYFSLLDTEKGDYILLIEDLSDNTFGDQVKGLTLEQACAAIQAIAPYSWGSVEIGMGATEGDSFQGMTLAEDFLIFEPVDEHDQPVVDFAQADRLLVTKLCGQVMPMVRYEMTDTVIIDDSENPDAPGYRRIKEIKGRADAWFAYPHDVKIHPMVFRSVLGQDRQISEYQVQQTPDGARVLAITHGEFSSTRLEHSLVESLRQAGLSNAKISIQSVSELPRHPETNKLKRFIPFTD